MRKANYKTIENVWRALLWIVHEGHFFATRGSCKSWQHCQQLIHTMIPLKEKEKEKEREKVCD